MKLIQSLSTYAIAMFVNAGLSFVTFSYITHHLSEVDYGIVTLYSAFTIFLVPFVSVGVQFNLNVEYFKMDENTFRVRFTNAILIPVISCVILTLLCLVLYNPLYHLIKVNLFFALILPFSCLLTVMNEVILYLIRNKEKHYLYAGVSIGKSFIDMTASVLLVIAAGATYQSRLGGALAGILFVIPVVYILVRKWKLFAGHFTLKEVKKIFQIGLPFIPERLAVFALAYSDRFFIDHYLGTGAVGFYSAGAQIALIVNLTILTLISTFHPYIFKGLAASDFGKVRKATLTYIGIALLITVIVILMTPVLFHLFIGKTFASSQVYARILAIGIFFWAVYNVFLGYLLFLKKNKLIMYISVAGMLLSVVCNAINVKKFGITGATYTSIIVYLFMAIASIIAVHKFYNLRKILFAA